MTAPPLMHYTFPISNQILMKSSGSAGGLCGMREMKHPSLNLDLLIQRGSGGAPDPEGVPGYRDFLEDWLPCAPRKRAAPRAQCDTQATPAELGAHCGHENQAAMPDANLETCARGALKAFVMPVTGAKRTCESGAERGGAERRAPEPIVSSRYLPPLSLAGVPHTNGLLRLDPRPPCGGRVRRLAGADEAPADVIQPHWPKTQEEALGALVLLPRHRAA